MPWHKGALLYLWRVNRICMHRTIHKSSCASITNELAGSCSEHPNIAIVGSGPAGFYTAQQILKGNASAKVDIYEQLPVPFGLVRFGVAPDHPEVKNVINTFTQTANHERCSFLGNVKVGEDISIKELRDNYTAVVLAYGSQDDRLFGIKGEDLCGVHSARSFVGWYNGLPEHSNMKINLDCDTAAVFGQGNVAIDVARILLTPIDILKETDVTEQALETLKKSRVQRVFLIGRRGPLQVAFTTAELREMTRIPTVKPSFDPQDFHSVKEYLETLESKNPDKVKKLTAPVDRKTKRLMDLMYKTALKDAKPEDLSNWESATKFWHLKFLRSPVEFMSDNGKNLSRIKLALNKLEGSPPKAILTGKTELFDCELAFRSIGYKSIPIDNDVPFDDYKAIVPNVDGKVSGQKGLYCSGWIKRGPIGVIVSTMTDAFETGKVVCEDLQSSNSSLNMKTAGKNAILQLLSERGVSPVTFKDWQNIDEYEREQGGLVGKPREKILDIQKMLDIAFAR